MAKIPKLPEIPEAERTPLVALLLEIIQQLKDEAQKLRDEVARLKGLKGKPRLRPSTLESDKDGQRRKKNRQKRKRRKQKKKAKLEVHETSKVAPDEIPPGSRFKGYDTWMVQDLKFEPHNVLFKLERWVTPDGRQIKGELPTAYAGQHFGPTLQCFILHQYYFCRVTQRALLKQLHDIQVDISAGQLNRILIEGHDTFHAEKDEILKVGLAVSGHITVDDTGSRHQGRNGYCTHVGNELFGWFASTDSKSRINFLKLLRTEHQDYVINTDALAYMRKQKLPQSHLETMLKLQGLQVQTASQWAELLERKGIDAPKAVQTVTEAAMIGSLLHHGFNPRLAIISDGAGQFDLFIHGLCWIHAERPFNQLIGQTLAQRAALAKTRTAIWQLYKELKFYKTHPGPGQKSALEQRFDEICAFKTGWDTLDEALQSLQKNKTDLLLVLERPDVPLHQNGSELDIREAVQRRKVSGGTRSAEGRKCRDTFLSLKKTCFKQGVSFWDFLNDRVFRLGKIPPLPELIRQRASELTPVTASYSMMALAI